MIRCRDHGAASSLWHVCESWQVRRTRSGLASMHKMIYIRFNENGVPLPVTLIASILCLSWLGMMIVHEFGHVAMAWTGGEKVSQVGLHPLLISRTDASHEKHPLLVIWGGTVLGSLIPFSSWHWSMLSDSGMFISSSSSLDSA